MSKQRYRYGCFSCGADFYRMERMPVAVCPFCGLRKTLTVKVEQDGQN